MECFHCKGKMSRGMTAFHIDRKTYHLTFDKIPAWVCHQWGEALFEDSEVTKIQDIVRMLEDKTEKLLEVA